MFNFNSKARIQHALAEVDALDRSQAVIEFDLDGTILDANENLLKMSGYSLAEIKGKHHSIFVSPAERESARYRDFWASLNRGEFQTTQYKRFGKNGKEVWVHASYAPLLDKNGKVVSFIKFATDITAYKIKTMEDSGKIAAINRAQAVIEFNMDGTIVTANENFLGAMGYSLDEIRGKHHSMFVTPEDRASSAYTAFWARLNRGEFEAAEYKRLGKGAKEIWILATYNPILDETGKPFKVVKFATDITAQKMKAADNDGQLAAIQKSQAVIEFNMDGTIRTANENFLKAVGYSLAEIKGRHHSMFVEPNEKNSAAYRHFWETLNRGEYQAAEYKRIAKGGREIWIQASYNPILDLNGKPYKVVKYATDITAQAIGRKKADNARGLIEAVAAGSEQMSASIREISETMAKSRETSKVATTRVESADGQAQKLTAAAQAMSGIVEMISGITSQINPACAQRHDRIGAGRRSGPRLCRGRLRGEEPRQPGQAGHRHDYLRNRRAEHHLGRRCELAHRDQGRDRRRQRVHRLHRGRSRGAEHLDLRHVVEHAARIRGTGVSSRFITIPVILRGPLKKRPPQG
ncbi:methyl-accepting chemotaxis protein [Bradyrhizobium sp. i1.7.7]